MVRHVNLDSGPLSPESSMHAAYTGIHPSIHAFEDRSVGPGWGYAGEGGEVGEKDTTTQTLDVVPVFFFFKLLLGVL